VEEILDVALREGQLVAVEPALPLGKDLAMALPSYIRAYWNSMLERESTNSRANGTEKDENDWES
jgi:hypothetical protein